MNDPNAEDRNNRHIQIGLDKVGLGKGMNGTETELYQSHEMGQFKTTKGDSFRLKSKTNQIRCYQEKDGDEREGEENGGCKCRKE